MAPPRPQGNDSPPRPRRVRLPKTAPGARTSLAIRRRSGQGPGHCVGGWRERSEHRVLFWEVVHAAGEAANRSLAGEAVPCGADRFAAAEGQEVSRDEHPTTRATMYG